MRKDTLRHWQDEGATEGELDFLRAARAEHPSALVRKRTLVALGLGTTGFLAAPGLAAAHAASKVGLTLVVKWAAVGAVCSLVAVTTAQTIVSLGSVHSSQTEATPSDDEALSAKGRPWGGDLAALPAVVDHAIEQAPAATAAPTVPSTNGSLDTAPGGSRPGTIASAAPSISASAIAVPSVAVPSVAVPAIAAPSIAAPSISAPSITALSVEAFAAHTREEARTPAGPRAARWAEPAPVIPSTKSSPDNTADLARETTELDRARRAIAEGNPEAALMILRRYDTQIGHGSLSAEALVLRVQALWMAGERQQARALVDRYAAAYPDSPYKEQLRRLVQPSE